IAVKPASQRVEAIAEGRSGVRGKPALADQELESQGVIYRHMGSLVIAHDLTGLINIGKLGNETCHEAIHLAAIDLVLNRLMTVIGTLIERSVREREGWVVAPLAVGICLATVQPIDVRPLLAIAAALFAQVAEHVIEGA